MAAPAEVSKNALTFEYIRQFKESHHFNIAANLTLNTMPRVSFRIWAKGGKTAICNLVGGGVMALSTCIALDNVAESGGILNPPILNPFFSEHLV